MFLGRGSQEQVSPYEAEDDVGRPGGEQCRQQVDIAHGSEDAGDHKIGDGYSDGDGDAGEGSALAHGKREGHGEDGHDERDDGCGDLAVELHAQPDGVKSALAEIADVGGELVEAHFGREQRLFLEILRLLADFGEGAHVEGAVAADLGAVEGALPSVLEDPLMQMGLPVDVRGEDEARDGEGLRVELEDGEVAEGVLRWIE